MIVPFISQYLVDFVKDVVGVVKMILIEIDEAEVVSECVMGIMGHCWDFVISLTPPILQRCVRSINESLSESFIDTMPLTIMSCLLGCMIVPWLLYKCDEFYNVIASKKSVTTKQKTSTTTASTK
eukprot:270343_1